MSDLMEVRRKIEDYLSVMQEYERARQDLARLSRLAEKAARAIPYLGASDLLLAINGFMVRLEEDPEHPGTYHVSAEKIDFLEDLPAITCDPEL
jgi:hypothetical protein